MNSYPDNQSKMSKKINGNKLNSKDLKTIQVVYGKKTTKKVEANFLSAEMADYCTQLFFLS